MKTFRIALVSAEIVLLIISEGIYYSCKKADLPIIKTDIIYDYTTTSASSGGIIISDGGASVTIAGVCWNTESEPTISDNRTIDPVVSGSFASKLTGLQEGTTYYVRAYAINSAGTAYGDECFFSTLGQAPSVIDGSATEITTTSAKLNSMVNAHYLNTTVAFEYGISDSYGQSVPANQSPVNDSIDTNISADLMNLQPGTTYYFRIKSENSLGTVYGSGQSFKTLGKEPVSETLSATGLGTTSATLNGTVNANYLSTEVTFEYGSTDSYGQSVTANQSPVNDSINTKVSAGLKNLQPGTTYYFRIKSANMLGTVYGSSLTFTTLGKVPTAETLSATSYSATAATLNGIVNSNYLATSVSFEYGTTTDYGSIVAGVFLPGKLYVALPANARIGGLLPATTYHFRVISANSLGSTLGNDKTFTTAPETVSDVEGNIYKVVAIGIQTQVWMAENLKTTKFTDGTNIPNVTDKATWQSVVTPAYCWYNNDSAANKGFYGALYNQYTVKNVCPAGWHVPSKAEWTALFDYVYQRYFVSDLYALLETGGSTWTNATGFSGRRAGLRFAGDPFFDHIDFTERGESFNWWSSDSGICTRGLPADTYSMRFGFSIRCIRD